MTKSNIQSTTILAVKKDGKVVMMGDGQATQGQSVVLKGNIKKVSRVYSGKVVVGFAGGTADAITLRDLFEGQLKKQSGDLVRASVETAKTWRSDKALRQLEAVMLVTNGDRILMIDGVGNVIEPEYDAIAIGSGGEFALSAARALLKIDSDKNLHLSAAEIARRSMEIASSICIYTNSNFTTEEIEAEL